MDSREMRNALMTADAPGARLVAGISVADSPLIGAVIEYARRLSEPYLFKHAMRSWLFAEAIGRIKGVNYDHEVIAIGTILHDIGLTASVSGPSRFEVNGADAALSFINGQGLSDRRAQLIWDLIALNSTPSLALHKERRWRSARWALDSTTAASVFTRFRRPISNGSSPLSPAYR